MVIFSNVFVPSPRLFRPFSLALLSRRTMPVRGSFRVPHPSTGLQRLRTWSGLRSVPRVRKNIWRSVISAASARFSPSGLCRPRGIPCEPRLWWMSTKSRHAGTKFWRQWKDARGNCEKVEWPTSLTHLSSSSQPDPVAGRPPLRMISLISSVILTPRAKARRWCTKHLPPAWAG